MDFLNDNYEYIVLTLLIISSIFVLIIVIYNFRIYKYFSNRRFKITSMFEIDPIDMTKDFSIILFNNNINDTRVISIGFVYKNKNLDYYKSYLNQHDLAKKSKILVPSRDSVKLKINTDELQTIIKDINDGKKRVSTLRVFAIDSLGITTFIRAKKVKKILSRNLKLERQIEHEKKVTNLKILALEKRNTRLIKRKEAKQKRQERNKEFIIKLKSKFSKK